MSFNRLPIFFLTFLLIIFSSAFALAADELSNQPHNSIAGSGGTSATALVDITSEYSQAMHIDFGVETTTLAPKENSLDSPSDFSEKYIRKHFTLPFYNGEETTWSLTSLSDK